MKTLRYFSNNSDRYIFDFNFCSMRKGWCQIDTKNDASYFGNWVHPGKLEIITFAEGDVTNIILDNIKELKDEIVKMEKFYNEQYEERFRNGKSIQIDCFPGAKEIIKKIGLEIYLS